jgi:hypothetical protein
LRMASLFGPGGQPPHVAVVTCLDEVGQSLPRFRTEAGLTEADRIETDPQRMVPDLASWIRQVALVRRAAE